MTTKVSWQNQKKALFAHANPERTIQSMKSEKSHLQETRNMLLSSMERITTIKDSVSNTSDHLLDANSMYGEYDVKLRKSQMYLIELKKKEASNTRKIKMSFWFLIVVVGYILIRRILFPSFYRWN